MVAEDGDVDGVAPGIVGVEVEGLVALEELVVRADGEEEKNRSLSGAAGWARLAKEKIPFGRAGTRSGANWRVVQRGETSAALVRRGCARPGSRARDPRAACL